MPRLTRPATFASTARPTRRSSLTPRANAQVLRTATRQLSQLGVSATRAVAGPVAGQLVQDVIGEVRRYRRGGAQAILESLAIQALGGVGRAITWLLGGRRGAPSASPSEVAAARQIVNIARVEAPIPVTIPGRQPDLDEPQPSTGRGGRRGFGDTGRGRIGGAEGGGRGGSPPGGDESGNAGRPEPNEGGITMYRVTNSSNVHSYGYDSQAATLYVRYLAENLDRSKIKIKRRSGDKGSALEHVSVGRGASQGKSAWPGPMYAYYGVPERVFAAMQRAVSKGKFVWSALRVRGSIWRHQYPYRLVAAGKSFVGRNAQGRGQYIHYVPRRATRKGFTRRVLGTASGREIQSNMSRTIGRKALERQRLRQIGF